jgi:thiol-disulfide isomerase/thioredoxin
VTIHDFTLVEFYADWCIHCRQFHPTWNQASNLISEKKTFVDGDANEVTVKFLKINCVEFSSKCQEVNVAAFPSVRLYKKDGSFEVFHSKRTVPSIIEFLTEKILNSKNIVAKHHSIFSEGCRVKGHLDVARTPGHFHLQAESHRNESLNAALTNVSHRVDMLYFSDDADGRVVTFKQKLFPFLSPLDRKTFTVERFHEAPQHYLKVVSTFVDGAEAPAYSFTHSDRVRRWRSEEKKTKVPQARFTYDFSPMSVHYNRASTKWYDFLTILFAITGGSFAVMQLCGTAVDSLDRAVKDAMGKSS